MVLKIDKSDIIDIHVPKWDTDPNFHGSYSFLGVKAFDGTQATYDDLMNPVEKLYFAGEVYDPKYSGFIQGAYFSGERVANMIS